MILNLPRQCIKGTVEPSVSSVFIASNKSTKREGSRGEGSDLVQSRFRVGALSHMRGHNAGACHSDILQRQNNVISHVVDILGGYSNTLPIRVCAAQAGRASKAPDLERGIHFRGVF